MSVCARNTRNEVDPVDDVSGIAPSVQPFNKETEDTVLKPRPGQKQNYRQTQKFEKKKCK